jgi:hypothetical protein
MLIIHNISFFEKNAIFWPKIAIFLAENWQKSQKIVIIALLPKKTRDIDSSSSSSIVDNPVNGSAERRPARSLIPRRSPTWSASQESILRSSVFGPK